MPDAGALADVDRAAACFVAVLAVTAARAVEDHAHAPLVVVGHPLRRGTNARPLAKHVGARALVAREDREEFHRQHGRFDGERFDDGFMRDRRARDPVEIAEAAIDCRLAVPIERRVGKRPETTRDRRRAAAPGPVPGKPAPFRPRRGRVAFATTQYAYVAVAAFAIS